MYTFLLKKFGCNSYLFQKFAIYNDEKLSASEIKEETMSVSLFLFLEGQIHHILICLFSMSCYRFVETKKLDTLVTKYNDILILYFYHIFSYHLFSEVYNAILASSNCLL